MKKAFVYKITSPSGKIYVGSTIRLEKRISDYTNKTAKSQVKIYRSIKKYGWSRHKFEVILVTTPEYRLTAERLLGDYYNCLDVQRGLNLKLPKVGDKICISEETRRKMSESNMGKKHSDETKSKLVAAWKRRNPNVGDRGRRKLAAKIERELNGMPQYVRQKISAAHKGKVVSIETRERIGRAHKGKVASEETRMKQSVAKKGKTPHPNALLNLKRVKAGEKRNPLHVANMHRARMKLILNMETGIYYESIAEASKTIQHLSRTCINAMLSGQNKNKSSFVYA